MKDDVLEVIALQITVESQDIVQSLNSAKALNNKVVSKVKNLLKIIEWGFVKSENGEADFKKMRKFINLTLDLNLTHSMPLIGSHIKRNADVYMKELAWDEETLNKALSYIERLSSQYIAKLEPEKTLNDPLSNDGPCL